MPRGKPGMKSDDAKETERLVLVRAVLEASVFPVDAGGLAALDGSVEVWAPVVDEEGKPRVFVGSKKRAIEQFAGKQDDPDARPGTYRAPPARSWKGGANYELPDRPKPEVKLFED